MGWEFIFLILEVILKENLEEEKLMEYVNCVIKMVKLMLDISMKEDKMESDSNQEEEEKKLFNIKMVKEYV